MGDKATGGGGGGASPFIPILYDMRCLTTSQFYLIELSHDSLAPGGFWPRFSFAMWCPLQGNLGNTSLIHSEYVAHPGFSQDSCKCHFVWATLVALHPPYPHPGH